MISAQGLLGDRGKSMRKSVPHCTTNFCSCKRVMMLSRVHVLFMFCGVVVGGVPLKLHHLSCHPPESFTAVRGLWCCVWLMLCSYITEVDGMARKRLVYH